MKPPLGARPRWLWAEHIRTERIGELSRAIGRYEADGVPVPTDWYHELETLLSADTSRPVETLSALPQGGEVPRPAPAEARYLRTM